MRSSSSMRDRKGEKCYGLCQCILGWRADLRAGADFNGKNKKCFRGASWCFWCVLAHCLGAIQIYEPFVEFAGAGASVPLLGFGNVLWKGVKEAVDQYGFLGIFMGGFQASAVGISAALVFGYLASLIFQPKMKK